MKKLLAMIVVALFLTMGCATSTHWVLKSSSGKYSTQIPNEVPKGIGDWEGMILPLYQSSEISLYGQTGTNPKNTDQTIYALIAVEGDTPYLVGVHYKDMSKGIDQYYVDVEFMSGKPASKKLIAQPYEKILSVSEIVKVRTGKAPGEIKV